MALVTFVRSSSLVFPHLDESLHLSDPLLDGLVHRLPPLDVGSVHLVRLSMSCHLLSRGVAIIQNCLDRLRFSFPVFYLVKHLLSLLKASSILHSTLHLLLGLGDPGVELLGAVGHVGEVLDVLAKLGGLRL